MSGFNIGFGVGLRFQNKREGKFVIPPEPIINNAILLESGSPMLLENGSYFMLESAPRVRTTKTKSNKTKNI